VEKVRYYLKSRQFSEGEERTKRRGGEGAREETPPFLLKRWGVLLLKPKTSV